MTLNTELVSLQSAFEPAADLGLLLRRLPIGLNDMLARRLLALRCRLSGRVMRYKRRRGLPLRDDRRELALRRRAERDAAGLGLRPDSGRELIDVALREAEARAGRLADDTVARDLPGRPWLRWLPPPSRWRALLELLPAEPQRRLHERGLRNALAALLREGAFDELDGRILAVEVLDLGVRWVLRFSARELDLLDPGSAAEASVRGRVVDLLQLAGRVEDADTLFFQRRLQLTGDVELGLLARNLLDRLPFEKLPLGPRILLQRAARLAVAARDAHVLAKPPVAGTRA